MEAAFGVTLNQYRVSSSPPAAAGRLGCIEDLSATASMGGRDRARRRSTASSSSPCSAWTDRNITRRSTPLLPGTGNLLGPGDHEALRLPGELRRRWQTIAIFGDDGYDTNDLGDVSSRRSALPMPTIVPVSIDAGNRGADPETTQDLWIAATVAPGATIVVYFTPQTERGWWDLITRVVTPRPGDLQAGVTRPSVLTSSLCASQRRRRGHADRQRLLGRSRDGGVPGRSRARCHRVRRRRRQRIRFGGRGPQGARAVPCFRSLGAFVRRDDGRQHLELEFRTVVRRICLE